MSRTLLSSILVALVASAAGAQATYVVGSAGIPQINDALALAAPGDLILVPPGSYAPMQAAIGVTVRALGPGVSVQHIVVTLPANQTMHLVGLSAFTITITGGRVTLDGCSTSVGCTVSSSNVCMQSCSMIASGFFFPSNPGLMATGSFVSAIDCLFRGCPAVIQVSAPSFEAIVLQNSTLLGSNLTAEGGNGYPGTASNVAPKPALRATASTVHVSDSTLTGGVGVLGGSPACAVNAQSGRLVRCTLTPVCTPAISTSGPLLGMHRPNPLLSPGPFALEFRTDPNGLVGVFFATGLGNLVVPGLEQPVLLDLATTLHVGLLAADATGLATGTWNVPTGLTNRTFFFQAVGTAPAPNLLQLSPVAGGVVN